jgi:hypothetical protein
MMEYRSKQEWRGLPVVAVGVLAVESWRSASQRPALSRSAFMQREWFACPDVGEPIRSALRTSDARKARR